MQELWSAVHVLHNRRWFRGYNTPFIFPQDVVSFYLLAFQMLKSYFVLERFVLIAALMEIQEKGPLNNMSLM